MRANFALAIVALIQSVQADMLMPPVRMRINTDLIRTIFNKGDQRILKNFEDISLPDVTDESGEGENAPTTTLFSDLKVSLTPTDGEYDNFDFKIALNDPEFGYLGLHGDNLVLKGSGKSQDGTDFTFKAPVDVLKMELEKLPEDDEAVVKFNPHATKVDIKQFELEIGSV